MTSEIFWTEKLKPLVERDQFIRLAFIQRGSLEDRYHPEMEKVHFENAQKLKKMIEQRGFPVLSNAGEEGVKLSWFILFHALPCPDFMREGLTQMRLAVAAQDYPAELLAYMEDRVAFLEGRGQLYGTNREWRDGELKTSLIEDEKYLDARRTSLSLPTMAEAVINSSDSPPPKDPAKKEHDFLLWLKKVGWRT